MANSITITPTDKISEIVDKIKTLNYEAQDAIYRALWLEHVMNDVRNKIEEMELEDVHDETDVELIAKQYVYDGEYDCELPYWDNIENLITNYRR